MTGPCTDLVVLDLSRSLAGALTTMLLCDNGAEITLVEPPEGHPLRSEPGFLVWARGKRSLRADLSDAADRALVQSLAAEADVLVESFAEGEAERLGFDDMTLRRRNPRLIVCSMPSALGIPEAGSPADDALIAASAGVMAGQPGFRPGPVFVLPPLSSYGAALLAVQGLGAALYIRERDGRGQRLHAPLLHGALAMQSSQLLEIERAEVFPPYRRTPLGGLPLYRLYQCQDGRWLHLGGLTPRFWPGVALAVEHPEWISDPRFQAMPALRTTEERQVLIDLLAAAIDRRPYAEWDRRLEEQDVPYAPSSTVDEFLRDPQVAAVDMVAELHDPRVGPMRQLGLPIHFRGTPGSIRGPAPMLGQDDAVVRAEVAARAETVHPAADAMPETPRRPALAGVRIIDCSSYIAGPLGPTMLADLGADVIKVESPEGDGLRNNRGFLAWNRGKRGLALDLKSDEGRAVFYRLVEGADVVVENMRPGVAERLGIDYETLRQRNPRLIYCSVTAYGPIGPYRHKPGFDPLMQARSGIERAQGGLQNPPVFLLIPSTDNTCAMLNAAGITLALAARERTGAGQRLETSLLQAACFLQSDSFLDYAGRPPRRVNDPGQYGPHALLRLYACADGWLFLAACEEGRWQGLAHSLGWEDLLRDPRFAGEARKSNDLALAAVLEARFAGLEVDTCVGRLRGAGVPGVRAVESFSEGFVQDPRLQDGVLTSSEHPRLGRIRQPAVLAQLSETPGAVQRAAPLLGQHTREILGELGYDQAAIDDLLARGIVSEADDNF